MHPLGISLLAALPSLDRQPGYPFLCLSRRSTVQQLSSSFLSKANPFRSFNCHPNVMRYSGMGGGCCRDSHYKRVYNEMAYLEIIQSKQTSVLEGIN